MRPDRLPGDVTWTRGTGRSVTELEKMNIQHSTSNVQRPKKTCIARGSPRGPLPMCPWGVFCHWRLDVECWMLNVDLFQTRPSSLRSQGCRTFRCVPVAERVGEERGARSGVAPQRGISGVAGNAGRYRSAGRRHSCSTCARAPWRPACEWRNASRRPPGPSIFGPPR